MKSFIVFLMLFFSVPLLAQDSKCWPLFRGDPALTGVSNAALPSELNIKWTFSTADQVKSGPVVCHNTIVVASMDGTVYGINHDGKQRWSFTSENGFEAPATLHDDKVYLGDMNGMLYCLKASTGEQLWQFQSDGQIMGSPVVYSWQNRRYVLFGSYDYFLYALNPDSGKLMWKYESDNYINGAPSCLEGKVVFGGCDGFLHVLKVQDGSLLKKVEVATYVAGSSTLEGNMAYTGDYDGRFSGIDIEKEAITWQWEDATKNLAFIASPALSGESIVVGCRDKFVYCFNKNDGSLQWKYNTGSRVDASAIISGNNVLIANMRGDVLILDLNTGKLIQSTELGSAISGTPALIQDRIIVAADDGTIYCLGNE